MRVEMMHEVASPSQSREKIEILINTISEEQSFTRPNAIREKAITKCIKRTALSLPSLEIARLDTKRAQEFPMLIELTYLRELTKI